MSTRARFQNCNDSKSLWNFTMCPGWSSIDAHVLRLAIMKYGCGSWQGISKHFPLKTCGQLNLQTQRLFGQQSLAEFNKINIDPLVVKRKNDKKVDAFRKNSCIVNTGIALTSKQRNVLKMKNLKKYGISPEVVEKINVPVIIDPPIRVRKRCIQDTVYKLRELYRALYDIKNRLQYLENEEDGLQNRKGKNRNRRNKKQNKKKKLQVLDIDNDAVMLDIDAMNNNNNNKKNKKTPKTKSSKKKSIKKSTTKKGKKRGTKRKKPDTETTDPEMLPKAAKRARIQ